MARSRQLTTARPVDGLDDAARQSQASQESAELAAYIADMTSELARLAGRGHMQMLAYFLNLARVEAEIKARENGGAPIQRER